MTPTTTDPLIATLFAIESSRFGEGVVHLCHYAEVERLLGQPNVLAEIEREIVVAVPPLEFTERFIFHSLHVGEAKSILSELGYDLSPIISTKKMLDDAIKSWSRLSSDEIDRFMKLVK